jgi:hypothetical protein
LKALELIAQYNGVLVSLASGTNPAAIETELTALGNSLSSFEFSSLTKLVEKASPIFGVVSQAVAMIDDLIKKEKFKEAVTAAQKPILGILRILREDSVNIRDIEEQLIKLEQDVEYHQITSLVKRLRSMANKYTQSNELDRLLSQHNESIEQLKEDDRDIINALKITHKPTGNPANAIEFETMKILVDQIAERTSSYNTFADQVEALHTLMEEYNDILTATQSSFVILNTGVHEAQQAATTAFLADALNLRKAIIEYREAKQK